VTANPLQFHLYFQSDKLVCLTVGRNAIKSVAYMVSCSET